MASSYFTLPSFTATEKETFVLFSLPSSIDSESRRAMVALSISRLHNMPVSSKDCVEAVVTVFCFALPDVVPFLSSMNSVSTVVVLLSASDITDILGSGSCNNKAWSTASQILPIDLESMSVNSIEGVYSGVASVLYAVGKQGGSGPEANSVKGRPAALISRFSIPEPEQGLLPGRQFGPTQSSIEMIYNSFATFTEARMKLVQTFMSYSESLGHVPRNLEILLTNFRLMRGAGQTHVDSILKLVQMHPWVVRVPQLSPYVARFCKELLEFEKVPLKAREYHRLLVPQSEYRFLSSDYKPLIAVAGSYIEEVEKSFAGYVYGASEYASLIDKVHSYEPSSSKYVGSSSVASILGIPEMELPTITTDTQTSTRTIS